MTIDPQQVTIENLKLTRDGYAALMVGNVAYAAVGWNDEIDIRDAILGGKTVEELTVGEFTRCGMRVKDMPAFVQEIRERAEHKLQLQHLNRVAKRSSAWTEWKTAQGSTRYGRGVTRYDTAGHGGFKVSATMNQRIPEPYRNTGKNGIGWYEEDSEWAIVATFIPELFTDWERKRASNTLRNSYPDAYEAVYGVIIPEGQSTTKDRRLFMERHANDWIVISAKPSDEHEGMTECVATVGGERGGWIDGKDYSPEEKRFLVPAGEYEARNRRLGFAIDLDRHQEMTEGAKFGM